MSDIRARNAHTAFVLTKENGKPDNTGALGHMTHVDVVGLNPKTQRHRWKDHVEDGVWISAPGKRYGHLTLIPNAGFTDGHITLPDGKKVRTLYLMRPQGDFYEPLGAVPSPTQAHVTNKFGKILLTTCPLLLRVVPSGRAQREMDVAAHEEMFFPTTKTMTYFAREIDTDTHLWIDDVKGGIWMAAQPGQKYGWLDHWHGGHPQGEQPGQIPSAPVDPYPSLRLVDPEFEMVRNTSEGKVRISDLASGDQYADLACSMVRTVNREAMKEEDRELTSTDVDTLFETYQGKRPAEDHEEEEEEDPSEFWV